MGDIEKVTRYLKDAAARELQRRERLRQMLGQLSVAHRVAFAASCSERLLPNFEAFAHLEGLAEGGLLREALGEAWDSLKRSDLPPRRVGSLIQACSAVTPDLDAWESRFAPLAHSAAVAVLGTLRSTLSGDPGQAVIPAAAAEESIRYYLDWLCHPEVKGILDTLEFAQWREQAPLWRDEVDKQHQDLEALRSQTTLVADFLDDLRRSSQMRGLQPIRRGLVIGRGAAS